MTQLNPAVGDNFNISADDYLNIPKILSETVESEFASYWALSDFQRHCLLSTNFWRLKEGSEAIPLPPGEEDKINSAYYRNPVGAKPKANFDNLCTEPLPSPPVPFDPFLNFVSPPATPQPHFSFFNPPITNTLPAKTITLAECYWLIKYPYPYDENTEKLRALPGIEEKKRYKARSLAYVCFSGIFSRRTESSLRSHSGLIVIDLDHLENPEKVKQLIRLDCDLDVALIFISPSGDGLKVVVPIDLNAGSHADYFEAISAYLLKIYGLQADPSGRDISRACFLCHDPHVYLNPLYNDWN